MIRSWTHNLFSRIKISTFTVITIKHNNSRFLNAMIKYNLCSMIEISPQQINIGDGGNLNVRGAGQWKPTVI